MKIPYLDLQKNLESIPSWNYFSFVNHSTQLTSCKIYYFIFSAFSVKKDKEKLYYSTWIGVNLSYSK